jgi:aryl-alcohol dehydrogenase-like predicted oxidoreductase
MRYVELGGARVSSIGLGTWQFGSLEWGYGKSYEQHEALRIVERALELGINLVDTAEIYGFGHSERVVGRAIVGRREQVFLATKLLPVAPFDPVVHQRAIASVRRLGTDRIDLYQVHWPNPLFPPAPLFKALRKLRDDGVIAHVGVSNYSLAQWRAAEDVFGGPIVSNQVSFSLIDRRPLSELLPWAQANGRLIIAYSPLAQGFLSAKYSPDHRPRGMMRSSRPLFAPSNLEKAKDLFDTLRSVARTHDAEPAQVALAWLVHHPGVAVIPGASSVEQVEFNARAAELDLSEAEHDQLTSAAERFQPDAGLSVIAGLVRSRLPV